MWTKVKIYLITNIVITYDNVSLTCNVYIIIRKLNLVKKQNSYFAESNLNKEM